MSDYHVRAAALADAAHIVEHRIGMFQDMGVSFDARELRERFAPWLDHMMRKDVYKGWVAEDAAGTVVAGGGFTIIPWPPGPRYLGDRLAFVYNVYVQPAHRRRGLAARIMAVMHEWCRREGITSLALNASAEGRPLYESLGYAVTASPMMFLSLD
jgi:GNAT superfamily N-acetyltransferase